MHERLPFDEATTRSLVSTGELPPPEQITELATEAYERYRPNTDGCRRRLHPGPGRGLARLFGICIVGVAGRVGAVGDTDQTFSIQSVSKPFVFALVCEAIGTSRPRGRPRRQQHRSAVQLGDGHRAQRRPDR